MEAIDLSFWRHKVCADIRRGSLERGRQTTMGWSKTIFRDFGRYVFGTLGNEARIIMLYYLVPYRLSSDPIMYDLEWPWLAISR